MRNGRPNPLAALTVDEAVLWVAEVLNERPSNVRADTKRSDLLGWDSLGQLVLMSALDETFGIKLTQAEIPSLVSVRNILDVLARHGRLVSP